MRELTLIFLFGPARFVPRVFGSEAIVVLNEMMVYQDGCRFPVVVLLSLLWRSKAFCSLSGLTIPQWMIDKWSVTQQSYR